MENFTPWQSLLGGVLIGLSSALLYLGQGRIAGISGIFGGMLSKFCRDFVWRYFFIAGLVAGGVIVYLMMPEKTAVNFVHPLPFFAIGGLLVGVGTRLGNGCTSGHGICGLGRRSPRSLAAVMTFMLAGGVTVFIMGRFL